MVLVVVKQKTWNLYPISIVELALQAFEGSYANCTLCVKDKFCPDCKLKAAYAKWILLVFLYALSILEGCMESYYPALLFDYVRLSFHFHRTYPNSHFFFFFLFPAVGMGNMVSYLVISTLLSNLCIHFVCVILTVFVNLTWFSPFHSAKDFLNRPDYFKRSSVSF